MHDMGLSLHRACRMKLLHHHKTPWSKLFQKQDVFNIEIVWDSDIGISNRWYPMIVIRLSSISSDCPSCPARSKAQVLGADWHVREQDGEDCCNDLISWYFMAVSYEIRVGARWCTHVRHRFDFFRAAKKVITCVWACRKTSEGSMLPTTSDWARIFERLHPWYTAQKKPRFEHVDELLMAQKRKFELVDEVLMKLLQMVRGIGAMPKFLQNQKDQYRDACLAIVLFVRIVSRASTSCSYKLVVEVWHCQSVGPSNQQHVVKVVLLWLLMTGFWIWSCGRTQACGGMWAGTMADGNCKTTCQHWIAQTKYHTRCHSQLP